MRRGVMRRGQRKAESLMTDTCTIERSTGETTLDETTGNLVPVYEPVYDGKCKFQSAGAGSNPEAGGFQHTVVRNECHIPFAAAVVLEDDIITCTDSDNPQMVGKEFRVTGFAVESYATAARIPVERNV